MPLTFPTLSQSSMLSYDPQASNALAMYPAAFGNSFQVRKISFLNDSEQRWVSRTALFSCILSFSRLNGYDLSLLMEFFETMRGGYVDPALINTFSITLSGIIYDWCTFDQDIFSWQVDRGETYSTQLKIKQVRPN